MNEFTAKLRRFLENHPYVNSFAISTPTNEDAELVVGALFELGFPWDPEDPEKSKYKKDGALNTKWEKNNEKTCYTISASPNQIFFCNAKFYEKRGRDIYSIEDIKAIELPEYEKEAIKEMEEGENKNHIAENVDENSDNNKTSKQQIATPEVENIKEPEYLCPYCGQKIKKTVKFCPNCGQRINEPLLADELIDPDEDLYASEKESEKENTEDVGGLDTVSEAVSDTVNETDKPSDALKNTVEQQSEKEIVTDTEPSNTTLTNEPQSQESKDKPPILNILGLNVNEEFHIVPNEYFNTKNIYRFNESGYREVKVGDNIWFTSNDEQDLAYIINHPNEIQVISKK